MTTTSPTCATSPWTRRRKLLAGFCAPLALAILPVAITAQEVDTSEWVCEFCPFESGHGGNYAVGAASVSEDSAYIGDGTGYDKEGVYVAVSGDGAYVRDAWRTRWSLEDIGLDARSVGVEGTRAGTFDYRFAYREIPRRQFNTTSTIFAETAGDLSLPPSWIRAPATAGFAALGASLSPRNIGSDRSIYDIGGSFLPGTNWELSAAFRRQEQDGNRILGASYFTNAALLPVRIDYATDEVDVGVRYVNESLTLSLGWHLSEFDNGQSGFGWQHPFTTSAGAESAELAAPPDNRFQQLTFSAGYALPVWNAYASFSAATGEIEQTEAFLAYTRNTTLTTSVLPAVSLSGDVDTSRLAFAFTASPTRKARLRLTYRYDERDNNSAQYLWNRVIAESFVSGDLESNLPYSFERSSLKASAEYQLFDTLRISAGYDRNDNDRDFQEVAEQSEDSGWGRIRWRPLQTLELDLRGGSAKRDIDRYNEAVAVAFGQNPLLRKYNLAYRYRQFGELTLSYSPTKLPVSVVVNSLYADDRYTKSLLGMTSGEDVRLDVDVNWLLSERTSFYVNAGLEDVSSMQAGSGISGAPDWRAAHGDKFSTVGAGVSIRAIADKVDLALDYTLSRGETEIALDTLASGVDEFPELEAESDYLRAQLSYRRSERLDVTFDLRYQRFRSEDWTLEGVAPATIPVVLTLGAKPYSPEVFIFVIGFTYRVGDT